MKEKILGLKIGIASVGHALIEYDDEKFKGKIIHAGSRIFEACEIAKTKESLNSERREFKLVRRKLSRRRGRLKALKQLFIENNILTEAQIDEIYQNNSEQIDVWDLRKDALMRKLTLEEFYRVVHQIAKRRGFKSIRKSEEARREGNLLKGIFANQEMFEKSIYQTIGQMFADIYKNGEPKRNKRDDYKNSIPREYLENELKIIFKKQRKYGLEIASQEFEAKVEEVIFTQRPLESMRDMVRFCRYEKNERCAVACAYTSEIFISAQKVINTSYYDEEGNEYKFSAEQIYNIIELAHSHVKVTYKQAKNLLNLSDEIRFKGLDYSKQDKNPEGAVLTELKKYQEFKKAIIKRTNKEYFKNIKYNKDLFNDIAEILTYEKSDETIVKAMEEKNIPKKIIEAVKDITCAKTMHLSLKAMENIIPYMLEGFKYSEACVFAGYGYENEKPSKGLEYLPVLSENEGTTNPVVNRSIAQTRRIINAIIRKYGKPDRIIIETTPDLGISAQKRNNLKTGLDNYQKEKEQLKQRCIKSGIDPEVKDNLLRYGLWEQQRGMCVYSQKEIDIKKLTEENYAVIDHILPFSKSLDDSLNNKVLCLAQTNKEKGNKIPYEYMKEKANWQKYSQWIRELNLPSAKTNRILRRKYEGSADNFISRNLNDSSYAPEFIRDYIRENLNCKVETRNKTMISFLKSQWGIKKSKKRNDKKYAIEAIALACSTKGMIKHLAIIAAKREENKKQSKLKIETPWKTFSEDIEKAEKEIFVSRAINAKIPSRMHETTIRSPKHLDKGFSTLKTDIKEVNLAKLETLYDKKRNKDLYNILKERLQEFNDEPQKAFAQPVYMKLSPKKKKEGQKPHEIRTIKLMSSGVSGMVLPNGFAKNDAMARVDVFVKENEKGVEEYYLVPIYVADFAKGVLPNLAIKSGKPESEWTQIDETFTFKFSLFKNTLISLNKSNKTQDELIGYYNSAHRVTGAINVESVDGGKNYEGVGVKSLLSLKKYQVDVLGNYWEIKQEKRREISLKGSPKKDIEK